MIIIRAMDPYELLWMVLLIVFVLGELATIGLTCIWFAAGALAALVMAMAGVNPVVQFLVFLVVSILLLVATRPWARKYVNAKMQRTNADSLIGENIRISERVSNMDQTGMAVVHGQGHRLPHKVILFPQGPHIKGARPGTGEEAKILAISGVKLIVEKV
jgi:membrane protein implicated in regulation of membrane protease activity